MKLVHSQLQAEQPQLKKLTRKQLYHERMVQELRRTRYADYLRALKDPEIVAIVNEAKRLNPNFNPVFKW